MIARIPSPAGRPARTRPAGPIRLAVFAGSAVLAALAVLAVPAPPAAAHPFGPPSTARISVHGSRVDLAWLAAEDDWVALGQSLGAFEDPAPGAVATDLTGEQKLQRSPRVHDYLLERISVRQDGARCPGRLDTLDRLLDEGARLRFDCPAEVVDLDVTVGALTDLNEAYRTMLTSRTPAAPERALFTAAEQTHRVRFTPGSGGLPRGTVGALAGVGAALLVGVAALVTVRLRRSGRTRPTRSDSARSRS
ncbi:hypothetical protein O7626_16405 [Micromonospora sp. WMMD1102]|uniref:hypothetical protein n=1 Tax=Micromonospora sp. WMMD1102 TaxID=3016105 RepID=UPI002415580C|nr:hypothetical protein [Micromonospora sp. WMMD1102]MDG4787496.1 hypothetical protein [Micromonospora sp. WMMD1102]